MKGIKILKIDITEWLIDAIYSAKQHPDKSGNTWTLIDRNCIVEVELKHKDFDFFIDFDLYFSEIDGIDKATDCKFSNYNHVSDLYPEPDMIDFDDNKLEDIYRAVLSHF